MIDLSETAQRMVAPGKGLLADDETTPHADRYLAAHGIQGGEEMRRKYRDLFLETPRIEDYLSGVILYEETLGEHGDEDGKLFPDSLESRGILAGIKVDEGLEPFPESPDEMITKGLIGLADRLAGYTETYRTTFTKWRAEIHIDGDRLPTTQCLVENAKRLASYACEAQKAGMVPLLEPEVLLLGTHSRARAQGVITETLKTLFAALADQSVDVSGVIVKTSMALSGNKSGRTDTPEEVAEATLDALIASVPNAVPGIVFLSGGQTPEEATENLAAISRRARATGAPWPLTFSYARALQEEALALWKGEEANVPAARAAFLARLKKVSGALAG